jgi:hypothetical protein
LTFIRIIIIIRASSSCRVATPEILRHSFCFLWLIDWFIYSISDMDGTTQKKKWITELEEENNNDHSIND